MKIAGTVSILLFIIKINNLTQRQGTKPPSFSQKGFSLFNHLRIQNFVQLTFFNLYTHIKILFFKQPLPSSLSTPQVSVHHRLLTHSYQIFCDIYLLVYLSFVVFYHDWGLWNQQLSRSVLATRNILSKTKLNPLFLSFNDLWTTHKDKFVDFNLFRFYDLTSIVPNFHLACFNTLKGINHRHFVIGDIIIVY